MASGLLIESHLPVLDEPEQSRSGECEGKGESSRQLRWAGVASCGRKEQKSLLFSSSPSSSSSSLSSGLPRPSVFCLPSTLSSRPPVCLSELDGARLHLYTPRASSPTEAGRWVPEWLGLLCPEATPASFETRLITVHQAIDDAAACLTRRSLALTCLDSSTRTLPPPHAGPDGPRGRATRGEGGRGLADLVSPSWLWRRVGCCGLPNWVAQVLRC